jgi:predicted exporter
MRRAWTVILAGALAASTAPSAAASDATLERTFVRGVAQLRAPVAPARLDAQLQVTLRRLRADRPSTASGRRGRSLAVDGFTWMRRRVQAQLRLIRNDSGNIEAAIRDAKRADRCLERGARLLRAAGRAFGIRVGKLDGR